MSIAAGSAPDRRWKPGWGDPFLARDTQLSKYVFSHAQAQVLIEDIFVCETPHRYFLIEGHTTKLPFINFLPNQLAWPLARRFSKRKLAGLSEEELLCAGIRGTTAREIMANLKTQEGQAVRIKPHLLGMEDHVDLWYKAYSKSVAKQSSLRVRLLYVTRQNRECHLGVDVSTIHPTSFQKRG